MKFRPPVPAGAICYAMINERYRQVIIEEVFLHYAIVTARVEHSHSGRMLRRAVRWPDLDRQPRQEYVSYQQ